MLSVPATPILFLPSLSPLAAWHPTLVSKNFSPSVLLFVSSDSGEWRVGPTREPCKSKTLVNAGAGQKRKPGPLFPPSPFPVPVPIQEPSPSVPYLLSPPGSGNRSRPTHRRSAPSRISSRRFVYPPHRFLPAVNLPLSSESYAVFDESSLMQPSVEAVDSPYTLHLALQVAQVNADGDGSKPGRATPTIIGLSCTELNGLDPGNM
ncbi:hypothetical protein C8R47DRAFT_1074370 [Mycena vitilis]|nr:hypothetical protein C8R47DRAFT_1074370 [Mycena vitilis]